MIIVDASVLIAHLDAGDAHHSRAEELLLASVADGLAASPLTLAEVLVGPARAGRLDQATAALSHLAVTCIPLNEDAPLRLAVLRAASGVRLPDCCVLLAAAQSQSEVATFDRTLAGAASALGIPVRG